MNQPVELPDIQNITISGKIGAGATTLAKKIAGILNWNLIEGGDIFERIHKDLGISQTDALKRPDHFDLEYEEKVKSILKNEKHTIIQSHLAGFDAQKIKGVFKILIICEDEQGNDKPEIRIDRLMNRDKVSLEEAKDEVIEREKQHLKKWQRLYANNDENWVYWDRKYYDSVINTYSLNVEETLKTVLKAINYKPE